MPVADEARGEPMAREAGDEPMPDEDAPEPEAALSKAIPLVATHLLGKEEELAGAILLLGKEEERARETHQKTLMTVAAKPTVSIDTMTPPTRRVMRTISQ